MLIDMKTIRTFIAISLNDQIRRETVRLIERLRQPDDGIRWVPTDNLHLTLKFLGEVENTAAPAVCRVVREVCDAYDPIELKFAGTGGLPSLERARVLYAGIEDPSGLLCEIVSDLDRAYGELGFKREPRDYTPHLTLGRVKRGSRRVSAEVLERLLAVRDVTLGTLVADTVEVVASFLDKGGPTYQVMDRVSL